MKKLLSHSAVMLIDAAKGVEAQTVKLFKVCRMRGIPIFTFVNKMDRLGREPLDLMGDIEEFDPNVPIVMIDQGQKDA